jgi:hypothetical protein
MAQVAQTATLVVDYLKLKPEVYDNELSTEELGQLTTPSQTHTQAG